MAFWGRSSTAEDFEVLLGNLGVGLIILRTTAPYDRDVESSSYDAASRLIRDFCGSVERARDQRQRVRPDGLLPSATLLWWHRLLIVGAGGGDELPPGRQVGTSIQSRFEVLDGFSKVFIPNEVGAEGLLSHEAVDGAIRGLAIATEDWIIADTTNRLLALHLRAMDEAIMRGNWNQISSLIEAGSGLVRDAQYLKLYMDERNRYLVQARREVWRSARVAWGLDVEVSELDTRAATVHMQLQEAAQLVQSRRDRSRNLILFAIGIFTAVQSLLVIYDFSVNDDVRVDQAVRLIAAIAVVLLGVAISLTVLTWKRRL